MPKTFLDPWVSYTMGVFGEPRINVLHLNIEFDNLSIN